MYKRSGVPPFERKCKDVALARANSFVRAAIHTRRALSHRHARGTRTCTRGPFIYVLVVIPALRSVTIMPSYFISQHPARLELLLPFCLLRFALACSYAYSYSHVLIIPLPSYLYVYTVYLGIIGAAELCDIELSLVATSSIKPCFERSLSYMRYDPLSFSSSN